MHFHLHPVFRVFLAWLLALAIPLQGMAATGALACAGHRAAVQAAAADAEPHAGHRHAMHDMHAMGADDSLQAGHHAPHADHGQASDKHACSACAACCVGGMLPVRTFTIDRADVAVARAIAVPDTFRPGIVPPRLERPPRAA